MRKLTVSMAALLLFATVAAAQRITPGTGFNQTIRLQPTKAGQEIGAEGEAMRKSARDMEMFAVKVQAKVEDGTKLLVVVSTKESSFIMGTVDLFFGVGVFKMEVKPGDPSMPPLKDLVSVYVTDLTEVLLQGDFPPPPM